MTTLRSPATTSVQNPSSTGEKSGTVDSSDGVPYDGKETVCTIDAALKAEYTTLGYHALRVSCRQRANEHKEGEPAGRCAVPVIGNHDRGSTAHSFVIQVSKTPGARPPLLPLVHARPHRWLAALPYITPSRTNSMYATTPRSTPSLIAI
jgi:hypothetical protein